MKHLTIRFLILCVAVCLPIIGAHFALRTLGMQAVLYFSFLFVLFIPYAFVNNVLFRKIYWFVLCLFTIAWSLTETGHYFQEHAAFNELALKILYESYWQELIEYTLTTIPLWAIIIAIVAVIFILIFIFRTKHRINHFSKQQLILMGTILFAGSSYYLFFANAKGDKAGFLKDEYLGNQVLNKYYKDIAMDSTTVANKLAPFSFAIAKNAPPKTYVLIIGESTSRHHFGIYNYYRNTTPLLGKRSDINTFTDVVSSNTSTIECLSRCLTMKNETDNLHDFSCVHILDVAKQCGFNTYWLSNQARDGILHNSITVAASRANTVYFAATDTGIAAPKYDQILLPKLQAALQDSTKNKLIILHLIGTHFQYKNRYPAAFNMFGIDDQLKNNFPYANNSTKLQTINEYDNSVAYNDYLIDSIFNLLQNYNNTSAIYFSDHGEELYDYRNFLGHTPQGGNPWLHDVPFITWHVADSLLINKNKPYQLNRFFYTLCDWMQIASKQNNQQESLFSNSYTPKPRTLSNGTAYTPILKK
jgi:heptose-I-phosphate ethanolaminephosphotransferase